jgi:hypothetical protein
MDSRLRQKINKYLLMRPPGLPGKRGLNGAGRSQQNEQDSAEQMRAESVHGQIS